MNTAIIRTLATLCLSAALGGINLMAQGPLEAKIPFDFTVGSTSFAAGDYTVRPGASQPVLMIRSDDTHWVKAGIEFSDGRAMLASVLTDGRSDWATAPYGHDARDFWVRATVANAVLRLQVSADGKLWPLMRLAPFPRANACLVGPMACTPIGRVMLDLETCPDRNPNAIGIFNSPSTRMTTSSRL